MPLDLGVLWELLTSALDDDLEQRAQRATGGWMALTSFALSSCG